MKNRLVMTLAAIGATAAFAVGGATIAGAASSSNSKSTTTKTSTPTKAARSRASYPAHGTAAHEALEKPVTGDAATKAQAAAVKLVGSGTAGAVTTDVSGNGYEVTVTKSDGSSVEIHLDSSFDAFTEGTAGSSPPADSSGQVTTQHSTRSE